MFKKKFEFIKENMSEKRLNSILTIQPTRSTHSSAVVTLQRPSNPSRLKISDRSFYLSSACTLECSTTPSSLSFTLFSISFSYLTIFVSIPQAAENSPFLYAYPPQLSFSLLDWSLGTLIWPACHLLVIPYPSSSIRSSAKLVLISCLSFSVLE